METPRDPYPTIPQRLVCGFLALVPLVPKVSAALWERWSPRDSVSHWTHDDLDLGLHTHPPAEET
jgi:hypothetical protein